MSYNEGFSAIYDNIVSRQVDFEKYASFCLKQCEKYGAAPENVLDVGCGSGLFAEQLMKKNIAVTGIDLSEDMLSVASSRLNGAMLICCDMTKMNLGVKFDASFCTLDGLNHLLYKRDFEKAIKNISNHIKPGGLFIFDLNTVYKHRNVLSSNTFVFEDENYYLVWQNFKSGDKIDMALDCFIEHDGAYERYIDDISERAYDDKYVLSVLEKSGFRVICKNDFETFGKVKLTSEKIIYSAIKE